MSAAQAGWQAGWLAGWLDTGGSDLCLCAVAASMPAQRLRADCLRLHAWPRRRACRRRGFVGALCRGALGHQLPACLCLLPPAHSAARVRRGAPLPLSATRACLPAPPAPAPSQKLPPSMPGTFRALSFTRRDFCAVLSPPNGPKPCLSTSTPPPAAAPPTPSPHTSHPSRSWLARLTPCGPPCGPLCCPSPRFPLLPRRLLCPFTDPALHRHPPVTTPGNRCPATASLISKHTVNNHSTRALPLLCA